MLEMGDQVRKYAYRRRLPHYQKADWPIFVTFCKLTKTPFPPPARDIVLRHCLHHNTVKLQAHALVVMPEHVHLLMTVLRDQDGWPFELHKILKAIKGASARSVNKTLGVEGPVWQDESFDHVVRSWESMRDNVEYMRQNPVRRGLVETPEDYPWLWVDEQNF